MSSQFRVIAVIALLVLAFASGCSILPGQQMTLTVDGVTVTCSINRSSIEGGNPGPESQTLCTSRAREAMGTVLGTQPRAEIESVNVAADGAASVCYTANGVRSCPQVLPAMPSL